MSLVDPDEIRTRLREFILVELVRDPAYPLDDDQAIVSTHVIDSFSLARVGLFVEEEFGVYIPDADLTVTTMDSLSLMVDCIIRHSPDDTKS